MADINEIIATALEAMKNMTPEQKANMEKVQNGWREERRQEKQRIDDAVKVTIDACSKKARVDQVFAQVFEAHKCPTLYIEWMLEKFWAIQSPKLWKDLERIHARLVRDKHTKSNKFNFNDLDDNCWYIPCKGKKVLCHTGQSHNHLYVMEGKVSNDPDFGGWRKLHIRRFYDVWTPRDKDDCLYEFDVKDMEKWAEDAKKGYQAGINKAQHFVEEYADDQGGNPYPNRLSLKSYYKAKFEMKYGDSRDEGYICTWKESEDKVDGAIWQHGMLKVIHECFVPSILCSLFENDEDDNAQVASTIGASDGGPGFDSWARPGEEE